jgi:serine/threonine-protein kinase
MVVLAAAFAGYYALLLHSDLSRFEPAGFTLAFRESAMLLGSVAPQSPAGRIGLAPGDRIRAANGHLISTRLDWLFVELNESAGELLHLDVERSGRRFAADLPIAHAQAAFWTTTAGSTLLTARAAQLVTLLLALVVAFRRPWNASARIGAWVLATLAIYSIVLPDHIAVTWRNLPEVLGLLLWVPHTSALAVAAVVFTFFAAFPRPIARGPWVWVAIWLPMGAALVPQLQFAARVIYRPDQPGGFVDWTTTEALVTAAYTLSAIAVLVWQYRRLHDLTERRRIRVLVCGSTIGLASILPIVVAYWSLPGAAAGDSVFSTRLVASGALVGLVFPGSLAYAILRHRLFDVTFIVRRSLQYALARRVLVSLVPASVVLFLIDLWVHRQLPLADVLRARVWGYLALAGLASLARFRRDDWLDALDRRFFRERHRAELVLRHIGEEVRQAPSLDAVAPKIVVEIEAALHPTFAALLIRRGRGRRGSEPLFRTVATSPTSATAEMPAAASTVVGFIDLLTRPLQVSTAEDAGLLRQLSRGELDWLAQWGIELFVPIRVEETTGALLALGPKRSDEPYSAEDEDLLMAIADNVGSLLVRKPPTREADEFRECPDCGACYDAPAARCARDSAALSRMPFTRLLGGRYRLDRRVGQGGMGDVYAAFDIALERPIAVKLLAEGFVGAPAAEERFRAEAQLAAGLVHPNVVTVHDFGVTYSGRGFLVMELLEGVTMRGELQRLGPLAPPRVVSILRDISAAVDAAHQRQMIHRDLKPENVFLCRRELVETAKVLDFGLAKVVDRQTAGVLTRPGIIAGTPDYMAPEQWTQTDPSPDWDLWALSVMAFEMVTGRRPFVGGSTAPPSFDPPVGNLPEGLRELFRRAFSVDPLDRPTSARELVDEVARVVG